MLVTALNTEIGYDNAAKVAKHAFEEKVSLREAAAALGILSEAQFDALVDARKMVGE
jgi:fumarate hydratase class II